MIGKTDKVPGEARANGPSVADTLTADRYPPPSPLLESQYEFLGDEEAELTCLINNNFSIPVIVSLFRTIPELKIRLSVIF